MTGRFVPGIWLNTMAIKFNRIIFIITSVFLSSPSSAAVFNYYMDKQLLEYRLKPRIINNDLVIEADLLTDPEDDRAEQQQQLIIEKPPLPVVKPQPAVKKPKIVQKVATISTANEPVPGDNLYLRLFKQEGLLELWYQRKGRNFQLYKTWEICTFSGGLGPKKVAGDEKSPEGFYATRKNMLNPNSRYHLSFNIGYPNAYDRANGYTGSYIMIHGDCKSIGCYAMTDLGIEEIYALVSQALGSGQSQIPIHIFPFIMEDANMEKYKDSAHYAFWKELKPAYDVFQSQRRVPNISVQGRKYVVR